MPIIYLTCLSCILSPLTFILLKQNINFHKYEQALSRLLTHNINNADIHYIKNQILKIYIYQHQWLKAIILLDNLALSQDSNKYDKTMAMILNKNQQNQLADKYYIPNKRRNRTTK